jgi:hypothetical protein
MVHRTSIAASVLVALALLCTFSAPGLASAQEQRCFSETGFCISGPIRGYWDKNGGLKIFGYPIKRLLCYSLYATTTARGLSAFRRQGKRRATSFV